MDLVTFTVTTITDKLTVRPTRSTTETWHGGTFELVREQGTRTVWARCPHCGEETNSRGANGAGYVAVRDMATQHLYDSHRKLLTFP